MQNRDSRGKKSVVTTLQQEIAENYCACALRLALASRVFIVYSVVSAKGLI